MKRYALLLAAGMLGVLAAGQANAATTAKMTIAASIVSDTLTLSVVTSPSLGKIAVPGATSTALEGAVLGAKTIITNDDGVCTGTTVPTIINSFGGCRNGKVKVVSTTDGPGYLIEAANVTNILGSGVLSSPDISETAIEGLEKTHTTPITVDFTGASYDPTDAAGTILFTVSAT